MKIKLTARKLSQRLSNLNQESTVSISVEDLRAILSRIENQGVVLPKLPTLAVN